MSSVVDTELDQAAQMLSARNFPQAELYLRRYLRHGGRDPSAQRLLSQVAGGYGIADGFELIEQPCAEPGSTDAKYLLIKAWGYGFWSDVHHVLGQLLLAELTGRIPLVHWGVNSLFGDGAGGNAFELFFDKVSSATLADVPASATVFPPKWHRGNLTEENVDKWDGPHSRQAAPFFFARRETLAVSDFYVTVSSLIPWLARGSRYFGLTDDQIYLELFARHLKPRAHIVAQADAFHAAHLAGRHWVAVHVRGSDKVYESAGLHQTNLRYFGFVDRIVTLNPGIGIFLLTDSVDVHVTFTERYGDRLVATPALRTASNTGVHMQGHPGPKVAEEVMVDALLAARCDYFVGNQESNVSLAIASLKDWPRGFLAMLGEKNGRAENLFLHKSATMVAMPAVEPCRLCDAPTAFAFGGLVLGRHRVRYARCGGCGALQTETPHWLAEAYDDRAERFDTGKASRTLVNFLALPPLLEILQIRPADRAVDFGGGTGLFARLMRDVGYDFHCCDKYGSAEFMAGYAWDEIDRPCRLVTIFEVAEHFADPRAEWAKIFAADPDVVVGSTGLYTGQGADWPYLSPESGQHVFFYSPEAIAHLAHRHGRHAYHVGMYFVLTKNALSADALARLAAWRDNLMPACQATFGQWARAPYAHATRDNRQMALFENLRRSRVRIAIDGVFFRFSTGISRVWKSLLAEWSASGFGEFIVVLDRARTAPRHPGIAYVDVPQHQYVDIDADRRMLQRACDEHGISLFISTYYTTPLTTPAALMVLDMIPEVMGFDLANPQWVEKHRAIDYAGSYLCISDSTARDLQRFCPVTVGRDVRTAYCGSDFRAASPERVQAFRAKFGIASPYFMISGVRADYKNAALFFKAFAGLGDARGDYAVVCTNAATPLEPEFAAMVGEATVHMVVLSDDELQCAYSGAVALAYPSRYEGFGLPVLESMACGCPVITCRISSIPEIGGDAVVYVDPDDVAGMQAALGAVQHEDTRRALITAGLERAKAFSWTRMADEVSQALASRALNPTVTSTPGAPT